MAGKGEREEIKAPTANLLNGFDSWPSQVKDDKNNTCCKFFCHSTHNLLFFE